jgi:hypothetical protein
MFNNFEQVIIPDYLYPFLRIECNKTCLHQFLEQRFACCFIIFLMKVFMKNLKGSRNIQK